MEKGMGKKKNTISKFKHGSLEWAAFDFKERLQMPVQKGRLWILRRPFSIVKNNRWSDSSDNVHHSDMLLWSLAKEGLDLSRQSELIKKHSVHVANWVG